MLIILSSFVSGISLSSEQTIFLDHFIQNESRNPFVNFSQGVFWDGQSAYLGKGHFESPKIEFAEPASDVVFQWIGENATVTLSLDDGASWCEVRSSESVLGECGYGLPSSSLKYRVSLDDGRLDLLRFEIGYGGAPIGKSENCEPVWECSPNWGDCVDGVRSRSCIDNHNCGLDVPSGLIVQDCSAPKKDVKLWSLWWREYGDAVWYVLIFVLVILAFGVLTWLLAWVARKRFHEKYKSELYDSTLKKGAFGSMLEEINKSRKDLV